MCLMRILLIFLFLLPFAASSQTREETEAWIMSKADVRAYELGLHYRIEEGEMIQLIEPISVLVGVGSDIEKSILLESVKTISYKHTDVFLSFVLICDYDCVYSVVTDPNEIGRAHVFTPVPNAHLVFRYLLERITIYTY